MRNSCRPSRTRSRSQQGAAAIELAIVTILMLLIVAGAIGFGRASWYADALAKATRDGARLMSTWPAATVNSQGVGAAQTLAVNAGNAANVSAALAASNIQVKCDYSSPPTFVFVDCVDATSPATTPANVKVSITGYTITIGQWFPFIGSTGVINFGTINMTPHTTMRYMN